MTTKKSGNMLNYSPDKYTHQTPMTQATTHYQEEASYHGGVPDLGLRSQARTGSPSKTEKRKPRKAKVSVGGSMVPSPDASPLKPGSPLKGKQGTLRRPDSAAKKKQRPDSNAKKGRPSEPLNVQMGSAPAFGASANAYVSQEIYADSPTKNKRLKMAQSMNKELVAG